MSGLTQSAEKKESPRILITDQNYREYEAKAEASKDPELHYQLAQYYLRSFRDRYSHGYYHGQQEKAVRWLTKAAEQMHRQALLQLLDLVLKNDNAQEIVELAKLCKELATKKNGVGAKEALVREAPLYRALTKLVNGYSYADARKEAAYLLAQLHKDDSFGSKDAKAVITYYEKAKEWGHTEAANELGDLYYYGKLVPKDLEKSFAVFYEICRNYYLANGYSYYSLALMYHRGEGVERNLDRATENYNQALGKGYTESYYQLALIYHEKYQAAQKANDWRIEEYKRQAINHFQKVSKEHKNWKEAQNYLGLLYYEQKQYIEAEKAWVFAAEAGLPVGQHNLAFGYAQGVFGEAHRNKAAFWYQKSAEQGFASAQYQLACGYEAGNWGLPRDNIKAFGYLHEAQEAEHEEAARKMKMDPFAHLKAWYDVLNDEESDEEEDEEALEGENEEALEQLKDYINLEKALGYSFSDPNHLLRALDRTLDPEIKQAPFERYEYLGDSCLNYVIVRYLTQKAPKELPKGQLDIIKQRMVSNETVLPKLSRTLGLKERLVLDASEEKNEVSKTMEAKAMEALIGAICEDRGLKEAEKVILKLWQSDLEEALRSEPRPAPSLGRAIPTPVFEEKKLSAVLPAAIRSQGREQWVPKPHVGGSVELSPAASQPIPSHLSRRPSQGTLEFFDCITEWDAKELKASLVQNPLRARALSAGKAGVTGLILLVKQLENLKKKKKVDSTLDKIECLLAEGAKLDQPSRKGVTAKELLAHVEEPVRKRVLDMEERIKASQRSPSFG